MKKNQHELSQETIRRLALTIALEVLDDVLASDELDDVIGEKGDEVKKSYNVGDKFFHNDEVMATRVELRSVRQQLLNQFNDLATASVTKGR